MTSPRRALVASVLVATAGLVAAQDRPPSPSAPTQGQQPSASASKTPPRKFRTATLVAFDVEKGTVTFKDDSGKSITWAVEVRLAQYARAYAEMRLQTLKEGERVIILYAVNAEGEPRVYDVRPAVGRGGRQRPGGDGPPAVTPASPAPPQ